MTSCFWFLVGFVHSGLQFTMPVVATHALLQKEEGAESLRLVRFVAWPYVIATALVLGIYVWEFGLAAFSDNLFEQHQFRYRITGPYSWHFWFHLVFWATLPLLYAVPYFRRRPMPALILALTCLVPVLVYRCWEHVDLGPSSLTELIEWRKTQP